MQSTPKSSNGQKPHRNFPSPQTSLSNTGRVFSVGTMVHRNQEMRAVPSPSDSKCYSDLQPMSPDHIKPCRTPAGGLHASTPIGQQDVCIMRRKRKRNLFECTPDLNDAEYNTALNSIEIISPTSMPTDMAGILPSPTRFLTPTDHSTSSYQKERPRYDCPTTIPLRAPIRTLLEITELPFIILWIFFSYWMVILCFSAKDTTQNMWLSAVFAGLLVGLALNANAYKYIVKPKTRNRSSTQTSNSYSSDSLAMQDAIIGYDGLSRSPRSQQTKVTLHESYDDRVIYNDTEGELLRRTIEEQEAAQRSHLMKLILRFPRFFNQLVRTQRPCIKPGNINGVEKQANDLSGTRSPSSFRMTHIHAFSSGMNSLTKLAKDLSVFSDTLEWELDIPTMVRFFIIPFAVSAISGMTADEEKYYLVFPSDVVLLTIALLVPTCVVIFLVIVRVTLLYSINVVWRWKVLFLNGCLTH